MSTNLLNKKQRYILPIEKVYFDKIINGTITCDFRKNIQDFRVGDIIHYIDVKGRDFEGYENLDFFISCVFSGEDDKFFMNTDINAVKEGYCVLCLMKEDENRPPFVMFANDDIFGDILIDVPKRNKKEE